MNPNKVICSCKKVTKGDILTAMAKGAKKFKDVKEATGAGSKCGKCRKDIKAFMKKHAEPEAKA
ncbi:MAG: bacterioferritin-associated ferredoxin [Christensenellales bacterium]